MPSYLSRASTSSTFSDPAPLWDPRTVLQILPDCRCVGWAYYKNRKCLNSINQGNLSKANTILLDIAQQQPDPNVLCSKLRRLAEHSLCLRNHQSQVQDMVDKWMDRVEAAYPGGVVGRAQRRASRESVTSSRSTTSSSASTSTSSQRTSLLSTPRSNSSSSSGHTRSESELLQETIASLQEALRVAQRRHAELESPSSSTHSSSPTVSRVSTSDISSLHLSRVASRSPTSSLPSSPQRATNALASSSRPCTRTHVRRRAIDEECPICQEPFYVHEQLVWCKSRCGNTLHKDCFEEWRTRSIAEGRRVTCVFCRAVWGPDCACDD